MSARVKVGSLIQSCTACCLPYISQAYHGPIVTRFKGKQKMYCLSLFISGFNVRLGFPLVRHCCLLSCRPARWYQDAVVPIWKRTKDMKEVVPSKSRVEPNLALAAPFTTLL